MKGEIGKVPVGKIPLEGKIAIPGEDGRDVFVSVPHQKGKEPPGLDEVKKFVKKHPSVRMWFWDGSKLRPI